VRERSQIDLRAMIGGVSGLLGVVCAVIGIFVLEGVSIEFPRILLGGLGYYLGPILGTVAVVLNVISTSISGLAATPQ